MGELFKVVFVVLVITKSTLGGAGPLVLMVGMDGFRHDYIDRGETPNFRKVIDSGVKAEHVVNVFPTKSRPNWYTIVTGLYPASHGVVNNNIYDQKLTPWKPATLQKSDPPFWGGAEPIWITNQLQGGSSCVYNFSFGGFVEKGRMAVNYHSNRLDYVMDTKEKLVDGVLSLFVNGSINFGIIYVGDVDLAGHAYGAESEECMAAVEDMDQMVGYILDQLGRFDLLDVINVLFVSDHGMIKVFPNQKVFLDDKVNQSLYYGVHDDPIYSIFPKKDEDIDTVYNQLLELDHVAVYKKENIPKEYHYRYNHRIPSILVVADVGWTVAQNRSQKLWRNKGSHGYSNDIPQMWPFFVAMGPAFKKGYKSKPFNTTDIYSLVCHILHLEPRNHNGSLENVKQLLSDGANCGFNTRTRNETNTTKVVFVLLLFLIVFLSLALLINLRRVDLPVAVRDHEVLGTLGNDAFDVEKTHRKRALKHNKHV